MAESGFLVDASGEPLVPAVAWFDGRTAPQAARWKERLDPFELFSRTGIHLAPRCSACKLEWHRENTPEAWSRADSWLGMSEYLVFRMTGEKSTDPSLASRTMLTGPGLGFPGMSRTERHTGFTREEICRWYESTP